LKYEFKTLDQWIGLWNTTVLPLYNSHRDEFEVTRDEQLVSTEDQDMTQTSHTRKRLEHSPMYAPGSPQLAAEQLSVKPIYIPKILSQKRRLSNDESTVENSLGRSNTRRQPKRPRNQVQSDEDDDDPEIPSTPEVETADILQWGKDDIHLGSESVSEGESELRIRLPSESLTEPDVLRQQEQRSFEHLDRWDKDNNNSGSRHEKSPSEGASIPIKQERIEVTSQDHYNVGDLIDGFSPGSHTPTPFGDRESKKTWHAASPEILETQSHTNFKPLAFMFEDSPPPKSPPLFIQLDTPSPEPSLENGWTSRSVATESTYHGPSEELPEEQLEESASDETLDTWLNRHINAGRDPEMIEAAIRATCMNPDLADAVLEYMVQKGRATIPGFMKGVWNEGDDECLEIGTPEMIALMVQKHGQENVDERLQFCNLEHRTA
jgi:hypothetical protein